MRMAGEDEDERMNILERIERGEIDTAEALRLLQALPERVSLTPGPGTLADFDVLDLIDRGEIGVDEGLQRLSTRTQEGTSWAARQDLAGGMSDGASDGASESEAHVSGAEGAGDSTADAVMDASPAISTGAAESAMATASGLVADRTGQAGDVGQDSGWFYDPARLPPEIESWKRWWRAPLATGIGLIVLGALLMFAVIQASGAGFWLACATLPLVVGALLAALAWISRGARWLHVRVRTGQASWPRHIAISFPIPIRLTAWALRTFKPDLPPLRGASPEELLLALEHVSPDAPFYVDVAEGENGERVQVFIG